MSGIKLSKVQRIALRNARERLTLNQHEMADRLGVTNVHVCNLERGHTAPSLEMLQSWCKALGYEVRLTIQPTMKSIVRSTS
jgi:transcriptional regulator with XRE-family HTH domain